MDWYLHCAYAPEQKCRFHGTARACLRKLAGALDFDAGHLRSAKQQAGIAGQRRNHPASRANLRSVCQPARVWTPDPDPLRAKTGATTPAGAIISRRCRCSMTFRRSPAGCGRHGGQKRRWRRSESGEGSRKEVSRPGVRESSLLSSPVPALPDTFPMTPIATPRPLPRPFLLHLKLSPRPGRGFALLIAPPATFCARPRTRPDDRRGRAARRHGRGFRWQRCRRRLELEAGL